MRRAQAAVEFLVLTGFMVFVFSTFFLVAQQRTQVAAEQEILREVSVIGDIINQEVTAAQKVRAGYIRTFEIPLLVSEQPYNILLYPEDMPSEVIITYEDGSEYVLFLNANLTPGSNITPGENVIHKENPGEIFIGPPGEDPPEICSHPGTTTGWNAGGNDLFGSSNDGIFWTQHEEITNPSPLQCCNSFNECPTDTLCRPLDYITTSLNWTCKDTGLGPTWYHCDPTNDGTNLSGDDNFCCSAFTLDPDGSGPVEVGDYGFTHGTHWAKVESAVAPGSCSDGSNNDCDAFLDTDPACSGVTLFSSCFGTEASYQDTAYEDLVVQTAIPGSYYAYDWQVGATPASIAVLNMNFDVEEGTVVRDYTSHSNNGTATNTLFSTGEDGAGAFDFNGVSSYVEVSDDVSLQQTGPFTVMARIKPHAFVGVLDQNIIITKGSGATLNYRLSIQSVLAGTEKLQFRMNPSGAGGASHILNHTITAWNQWYHLTGVWDGSTQYFYVDGVLVGSQAATGTLPTGANVFIGKGITDAEYYDGLIDDIVVLDRALSAEQVAIYSAKRPDQLSYAETVSGEEWVACVTPNDGTSVVYEELCSNTLVVNSNPSPCQDVSLSSSCSGNTTEEDLQATLFGFDEDAFMYDWRVDGESVAIVNYNFDVADSGGPGITKDYSTFGCHGTEQNGVFWQNQGNVNSGGYYFVDDADDDDSVEMCEYTGFNGNFTMELMVKPLSTIDKALTEDNCGIYGTSTSGEHKYAVYPTNFNIDGSPWCDVPSRTQVGMGLNIGSNMIAVVEHGPSYMPALLVYEGTEVGERWMQVVVVYEDFVPRLYIDGELVHVGLRSLHNPQPGRYLGGNNPTYGNFIGRINYFRLYNRSLSDQQVLDLYFSDVSDAKLGVKDLSLFETENGEQWTVEVTPNDQTQDYPSVLSNPLDVLAGPAPGGCYVGDDRIWGAGANADDWNDQGIGSRVQRVSPPVGGVCIDEIGECSYWGGAIGCFTGLRSNFQHICSSLGVADEGFANLQCKASTDERVFANDPDYCCSKFTADPDGGGSADPGDYGFYRPGTYKREENGLSYVDVSLVSWDTCADNSDNDCDGLEDCADPDCSGYPTCAAETICDDGIDNDDNGVADYDGCTWDGSQCLVEVNEGLEMEGDPNCAVGWVGSSLTKSYDGTSSGMQVQFSCTLDVAQDIKGVKGTIEGRDCWFSNWEGDDAWFACKGKETNIFESVDETVVCEFDPVKVPGGSGSLSDTVKICGKREYFNGVGCSNNGAEQELPTEDFIRKNSAGFAWTGSSTTNAPYCTAGFCDDSCPVDYCVKNERCYARGQPFLSDDAEGPWTSHGGEPLRGKAGWVCGRHDGGGTDRLYRCGYGNGNPPSEQMQNATWSADGADFCCTHMGLVGDDEYRFMPGSCPIDYWWFYE